MSFFILFIVALAVSSIGWYKFVYFISLGYGFSMAALGLALLFMFAARMDAVSAALCVLLMVYGCRLGGYLLVRERRSAAYNKVMATQVNDGSGLSAPIKAAIWVVCALLYVCEASPVLFRLQAGVGVNFFGVLGLVIMAGGIALEAAADYQKSAQKKANPKRFCDQGLYSVVRCPNYLGEVLCWTGVLISGIGAYHGVLQWLAALCGWAGIVYVMFGGARRLELRQNRNYGADPAYRRYVKSTPILLPFVPLYSVAKYEWLKG